MSLTTEEIKNVMKTYAIKPTDTGSPQVQIALLTARVNKLTEHFKVHTKDHHGRRGLLMLVGQRRRLLNYLERKDRDGYKKILDQLSLRK
jgi:small subunit ribosomal protein S15